MRCERRARECWSAEMPRRGREMDTHMLVLTSKVQSRFPGANQGTGGSSVEASVSCLLESV